MRKLYQSLISFSILFLILSTVQAQEATFFENFDNTEMGELPEGWTYYQKGGNNPESHWIVSKKGFFGPKVAWSNWGDESVEGDIDSDWLITPEITPKQGDLLIFDGSQESTLFNYGGVYRILISTASADTEDFKDTIASYTEEEFPADWGTLTVDLSAYEGEPIYIAFVHENPSLNKDEADDWYLDNVWVRPSMPAGFYSGEMFHQAQDPLPIGHSSTGVIVGVKVRITGDYDFAKITSFTFSTKGSTDPSKITKASLYTTRLESFIATNDDENDIQAEFFGSASDIGEIFEIKGDLDLEIGDNYFWLFYTIDPGFNPTYPYLDADASFEKVIVNGNEYTAEVPEVEGARAIVPTYPVNDSIKNSIELSVNGGRYGSYNKQAKPEPEYEKLAYCAPDGFFDVANSIWWHFTAPSNGYITADLSSTNFNTILLILDKNFDQFACNDNISIDELQSKIAEYEVKAGQELYFRVTGAGGPGDPNGPAGVVIMDFTFTNGPLGSDDPAKNGINLFAPYPNPAKDETYLDFELKEPAKLSFDVRDVLGKSVWSKKESNYAPGVKHTLAIDAAGLVSGTYILHVKGNKMKVSRKLIITE